MARSKRTKIAVGIYKDAAGFSICWQESGKQQEARYPLDTPKYRLTDFRRAQIERVAKQPKVDTRHGLARDVVRYLKLRKGRPSYKSERSHLRAWVHRYPRKSRWALTREDCQQAVAEWRAAGKSAQTLRHRVKLLLRVYRTLDGPRVETPVDDIEVPTPAVPRPRAIPDDIVCAVATQLHEREATDGRMRNGKTRARYLVLATTGQRPAQLKRAVAADVDIERRLWFVRPAKGDRGAVVYLNDDMLAAWQLFIRVKAWGAFDSRSFVKTLHRAGWPRHIRPYNLRHSVGVALSELGVELADILGAHGAPIARRHADVLRAGRRLSHEGSLRATLGPIGWTRGRGGARSWFHESDRE